MKVSEAARLTLYHRMLSDKDEIHCNPSVRVVEFEKTGQNCGFHLTRGKWDPYPWVSKVDDHSVSNVAGLKPGDCLLEVNGEDVVGQKISEIAEVVKSRQEKVSLLVWNAGVDPQCSPEALCCGPIPSNLQRLSACMSTILAFLECPVCLDTIPPPTYQCDNGHLICIKCRAKSERCPVCRLRLSRGRSLVSDQVYNAVIEAFNLKEENDDSRAAKIQQIFKSKTKNKNIPNIKVTQCHTNKFLARIVGKSSSVDNLSSSSKLTPDNSDPTLKMKSLSSNEIFQAESPTVSRSGSISRLSRKIKNETTMDDSLTNISDFGTRPVSFHGSFEYLNSNEGEISCVTTNSVEHLQKDELMYYCPFDSTCTSLVKGNKVTEHFQTHHTGPLVQFFGPNLQVSLKKLERETSFMIITISDTFFVKTLSNIYNGSDQSGLSSDILIWCWHLGPKNTSKNFEMEVELKTKLMENPFLRVRSSVFSLNSTSFLDVRELKKGIYFSANTLMALDTAEETVLNINIRSVDT